MANFPSTLPAPMIAGYSMKPQDAVIRTDMDSGSQRVRRRFTRTPTRVNVSWTFTQLQFSVFESWFDLTINQGASWFDINLVNGEGFTTMNARFVSTWTATALQGANWEVKAELEIETRPIMTSGELAPYL